MADQVKKYRYFKMKGNAQTSVFVAGVYFNRENVHRFEDGKVPNEVQLYKNQGILAESTESEWNKYVKEQKQNIQPEKMEKTAPTKEKPAKTEPVKTEPVKQEEDPNSKK